MTTDNTTEEYIQHPSVRKLGYSRPQQQPFSNSARNRSSVLALGRIDHLQHYFSKTERLIENRNVSRSPERHMKRTPSNSHPDDLLQPSIEEFEEPQQLDEAIIAPLPPSPPRNEFVPSMKEQIDPIKLRRDLALQIERCKELFSALDCSISQDDINTLLDSLTTCIRSARTYSTSIPSHQSLAMSFSVFREDALLVLSLLRNLANRAAADPVKVTITQEESTATTKWLDAVAEYLDNENPDKSIISESMNWIRPELWSYSTILAPSSYKDRSGDVISQGEILRFDNLLACYSDPPSMNDPSFLEYYRDGIKLCLLYNAIVRRSSKPFGLITRYHTDTTIQYRFTDNLTYWRAAIQ